MSQQETASPCIGVCTIIKQHNICGGCYRTPIEISDWFNMSEEKKQETIKLSAMKKRLLGDIL